MKKSERLNSVKRLEEHRENNSAQAFGKAQLEYQNSVKKLEELNRYRLDYLAEFQARSERGISGNQLTQYKMFLTQLDDAITQQHQQIQQIKLKVNEQKQHWQKQSQRSNMVQNLQSRLKKTENDAQQRKATKIEEDQLNTMREHTPTQNVL